MLSGRKSAAACPLALAYVEGFEAAEPDTMSTHEMKLSEDAAKQIEGNLPFRLANGYSQLPAWLHDRMNPHLANCTSIPWSPAVEWRPGSVTIQARNAIPVQLSTLPRHIITFSLGVMQSPSGTKGAGAFYPPLLAKADALNQLRMGRSQKSPSTSANAFATTGLSPPPPNQGR